MDFHADFEVAFQLMLSVLIGAAIGAEREYRSKAAGLRTMIMICLGSTIFVELSSALGPASSDRIASNIITGIGFLGAGVIFKDGLTISGITTATTIWITAALGMAVGAGEYFIALVGSLVVLIVLTFFENIQQFISRMHQERTYKITFHRDSECIPAIEKEIQKLHLKFRRERELRNKNDVILHYHVVGREKPLDEFTMFLKYSPLIVAFEY